MTDIQNPQDQRSAHRAYWLDLARALAIISVSVNHAMHRSFSIGTGSHDEFMLMSAPASALKALLYLFSRIGVPLFLMISGALLVSRDFGEKPVLGRFIRHNWWGLLRTTLIWLFIFFWYLQIGRESILRTKGFLPAVINCLNTLCFFNQTTLGSMWYMPMILCIYLMIPVISVALNRLGDKYVLALASIVLISGMIIPNLNTILDLAGADLQIEWSINRLHIFSLYLVYVLAGYWISTGKPEKIGSASLWGIFSLGVAATALFQYWIYSFPGEPGEYRLDYSDIGVFVVSVSLFELFRRNARVLKKLKRPVTCLARIAFGIFFVHIAVMDILVHLCESRLPSLSLFPKFILLESVTIALSVFIILTTSKIRFFRQYLYLIKD